MKRRAAWISAPVLLAAAAAGLLVWSPWSPSSPALTLAEAENKLLKQYAGKIESSAQTGELYEMRLRTDTGLYAVRLSAEDGQVESIERLEAVKVPPPEIVSREAVKVRLEQREGLRVQRLELDTPDGGATRLYVAEVTNSSGERRSLEIDAYTGDILTDREAQPSDAGGDKGTPGTPGAPDEEGPAATPPDLPGQPQARLLSEDEAKAAAAAALNVQASAVEDTDAELRRQEDGQAYYLVDVELKNGREAEVQINAVSGAMLTITWDEDDPKPEKSGKDDPEREDRSED
ncbi:hypothetical protein CDO73_13580 [Saccharibacillus sp. O23]|uniref:PepSY domain-containing protein n=1 Tax=Saccharibacillus sp. O23 TaxID=2009338 RepID=UPI000B4DFBB1|nr:PepSY domain-containing protein [Saccharibacillus sp. O23]OWR30095.1 hypothetical protein CDO73_13580 [Saccharibacillus sp. O23]